jgi:hypothetical protein
MAPTGGGVYVTGRVVAPLLPLDVEGSCLAAGFLAAGLFAAGFFLATVFLATVAPAFFFIFMGRTLQQRPGTVKSRAVSPLHSPRAGETDAPA